MIYKCGSMGNWFCFRFVFPFSSSAMLHMSNEYGGVHTRLFIVPFEESVSCPALICGCVSDGVRGINRT